MPFRQCAIWPFNFNTFGQATEGAVDGLIHSLINVVDTLCLVFKFSIHPRADFIEVVYRLRSTERTACQRRGQQANTENLPHY